jgi:DNA-binding response OmpR family regulator
VAKILVITNEPSVGDALATSLRAGLDAEVELALTGQRGTEMIMKDGFDLAIIDCILPDISGIELASLAANESTPVILISGDAEISLKLHRFGYRFLIKPFTISQLLSVSAKVILESRENIGRVKAAAIRMLADAEALEASLAASKRLLDEGEAKWLARGFTLRPTGQRD